MMLRVLGTLAFVLIIGMAFTACQPALQAQRLYAPPPRSAAEVARMWNGRNPFVKVVEINGKPVHNSIMWGSVIEVLPGTHKVTVKSNTKDVEVLPWYAKAGKEYEPAVFQNKMQKADNRRNTLSYGSPVIIPVRDRRFLPKVK